ncbi:hypothetical protein [Haloarchaeobius sp. TZWWS8]|uniref:hypothetical protein n=1 Tax=Haloarchaeobius sp. TZWWS8 TaxID=3446121 RepID=UPI003EBAAA87
MRIRHAALLVLLVVLAGCGGFADGKTTREPFRVDDTATATATSTDAPDARGPVVVSFDTGENRIENLEILAGQQERFLDGTSYRVTAVSRVVAQNGTVVRELVRDGSYARNRSRYVYTEEATGTAVEETGETTLFADGDRVFRRQSVGNETRITVLRDDGGAPFSPTEMGVFRGEQASVVTLAFETMAVTDVDQLARAPSDADEPLFSVRSDRIANRTLLEGQVGGAVENATLEAIVTQRGFVRELRFEYVVVRDGERRTVTRLLVYRGVGTTTVERPGRATPDSQTSG